MIGSVLGINVSLVVTNFLLKCDSRSAHTWLKGHSSYLTLNSYWSNATWLEYLPDHWYSAFLFHQFNFWTRESDIHISVLSPVSKSSTVGEEFQDKTLNIVQILVHILRNSKLSSIANFRWQTSESVQVFLHFHSQGIRENQKEWYSSLKQE